MNKQITYTDVYSQLEKLKSQNLIISDEAFAISALSRYGYSNLIKSYREPYIIRDNDSIYYKDGVTFEQILSLFILDKNLRNSVMAAMLDLEEFIKEAAADVISKSFSTVSAKYLNYRNYANKKRRKKRFTLSETLEKIKKALYSDKDPIHHYMSKYGDVPPWILFKGVYFTTIVNFVGFFKTPEQNEMISHLYHDHYDFIYDDSMKKLMMDTLFICIDYRNMSAHGGRIYNYHSRNTLRKDEIFHADYGLMASGFSELLFILSLLSYTTPFDRLNNALQYELNRHCSLFPDDSEYLSKVLNIDIVEKDFVYYKASGSKYHTIPSCSGMQDAIQIDIEEAKSLGLTPCKRCCN